MLKLEAQYRDMPGDEGTKMLAGMTLMAKTPGILGITQDAPQRWIDKMAAGPFADIEGGQWEESFLQRSALRARKRAVGVDVPELDYDAYGKDITKTVYQQAQDFAEISLGTQTLGIQEQFAGMGLSEYTPLIEMFGKDQVRSMQQMMSLSPNRLTEQAMLGNLPAKYAIGDINMQGIQTGLRYGTTSLQMGQISGAVMGQEILGSRLAASATGQAMIEGFEDPAGNLWGGTRGAEWEHIASMRVFQDDQMGLNQQRIGMQAGYLQNIWAIQDKQRALQHRQRLWGFEMQEQQFEVGGAQWEEQRGLARRGQLQQRGWQQQDWAMQDQERALQWQWKQEDFDENIRFMSGRQRKLAERGMERQTVMHGLEETQVGRQKERQEELWRLADERFNMERDHWETNRELVEENMEKQREFYDEGKKYADEMIEAQRAYQLAQLGMQQKQLDLQIEQIEAQREYEDSMRLTSQFQGDSIKHLRMLMELDPGGMFVDMINAIMKSMGFSTLGGSAGTGHWGLGLSEEDQKVYEDAYGRAVGGDMIPGVSYLTGEFEPELVRSGTIGSVATLGDLRTAERLYHDRWDDSSSFSSGQQSISIYIGEKKIKEFIIDTISKELKVH
jgi:hypothetical protein